MRVVAFEAMHEAHLHPGAQVHIEMRSSVDFHAKGGRAHGRRCQRTQIVADAVPHARSRDQDLLIAMLSYLLSGLLRRLIRDVNLAISDFGTLPNCTRCPRRSMTVILIFCRIVVLTDIWPPN